MHIKKRCVELEFVPAIVRSSEMKTQSPSGSRGRAGVRISNLPPYLSLLCMLIYIKDEYPCRLARSTLTVYYDGQFWVGLVKHVEDGRFGIARIDFGAELSDEEILQFVMANWEKLVFFSKEQTETREPAKNEAQAETSRALISADIDLYISRGARLRLKPYPVI